MTEKKRIRTDAIRKKENEYKKKTRKQFTFHLVLTKDADLIEVYEGIENKREFIRNAIRRYAEENGIEIKTEDE